MASGWSCATVGAGARVDGRLGNRLRAPRVNDKRVDLESGERKTFSSRILPAYARRSPKVTDVLPVLYLHGLSTGDFGPALRDLLGEDASGLSASSISRLTEQWQAEHAAFRQRSLRFHRPAQEVKLRHNRTTSPTIRWFEAKAKAVLRAGYCDSLVDEHKPNSHYPHVFAVIRLDEFNRRTHRWRTASP